jgi:hypothetical protein
MELHNTISVYGHEFSLNVAVKDGLDWTGKAPKWVHYCLIQLGDNKEQAQAKAQTIKAAMGDDYKCTLRASPKVASYSEDI